MPAVLIVEDDALVSLDISETLRANEYDVITVTNADDAIVVLEFPQ